MHLVVATRLAKKNVHGGSKGGRMGLQRIRRLCFESTMDQQGDLIEKATADFRDQKHVVERLQRGAKKR